MVKYSFMIPLHNKSKYLAKCLDSILAQTYHNYEIVIVVDYSTDNSFQIAKMYQTHSDQTIRLYKNAQNLKLGKTRNVLLDKAEGRYLIFVDPDDYVEPQLLEKVDEAVEEGAEIVRFQNVAEEQTRIKTGKNPFRFCCEPTEIISGDEALKKWIFGVNKINTLPWTYCVKKELYDDVRYPDFPVLEDFAITPVLIAKAKTAKAINYIGYHYVQNDDSLTSKKTTKLDELASRRKKLSYMQAVCVDAVERVLETHVSARTKQEFTADVLAKYNDKVVKYNDLDRDLRKVVVVKVRSNQRATEVPERKTVRAFCNKSSMPRKIAKKAPAFKQTVKSIEALKKIKPDIEQPDIVKLLTKGKVLE